MRAFPLRLANLENCGLSLALGAVKKALNPECNSTGERTIPRRAKMSRRNPQPPVIHGGDDLIPVARI